MTPRTAMAESATPAAAPVLIFGSTIAMGLLLGLLCAVPAAAQPDPGSSGASFLRGMRVSGRTSSWKVEGSDSTTTVRQIVLPAEVDLLPDPRLRVRVGADLRSQGISGGGEESTTGLAGGWIDARCDVAPRWLVGAGLTVPFRDPSVTVAESRIVSWLEETGLQMPAPGLALDPSLEARVAHTLPIGAGRSAAGALGLVIRLPRGAIRGESDLDPGDLIRVGFGIEGPFLGLRGAATLSGTAESFTGLGGSDRYREGSRAQLNLICVRPGKTRWQAEFGSYLQAKGEAVAGWPAPSGGTLLSAGLGLGWGSNWQWSMGVALWRSRGFDDLIGDLNALRPSLGVGRAWRGQRIQGTVAPAFGAASDDRSLRGIDLVLDWSLLR